MKTYSNHPAAVKRKQRFDNDPLYQWRERRNTKVRFVREAIESGNIDSIKMIFEDLVKHLHEMPESDVK
jgi:hypothetical protein